LALVALSSPALAQVANPVGFLSNLSSSSVDRLGANTITAEVLQHFDDRHYRDWMLDPADPTGATFRCRALRFHVQDQVGTTAESVYAAGYPQHPTQANQPDAGAPWFRTGPIALPPSPVNGPVAYLLTVTLPATLPSLPKGDVWLGVGLAPATGTFWPLDGTSVAVANETNPGRAIATLPNNQVACYLPVVQGIPTGPAVYPTSTAAGRRQLWLEVIAEATGGVCVARRQTITTSGLVSGSHPDVYNAAGTMPPTEDDIGFTVTDASLPNALAFVYVGFAGNPLGSQPVASLSPLLAHPGTRGNLCIDLSLAAPILTTLDTTGRATSFLTLSAGARLAIQAVSSATQPFDLWYQALVLDPTGTGTQFAVHATGCGIQHL
jgi:hypothetical protein